LSQITLAIYLFSLFVLLLWHYIYYKTGRSNVANIETKNNTPTLPYSKFIFDQREQMRMTEAIENAEFKMINEICDANKKLFAERKQKIKDRYNTLIQLAKEETCNTQEDKYWNQQKIIALEETLGL